MSDDSNFKYDQESHLLNKYKKSLIDIRQSRGLDQLDSELNDEDEDAENGDTFEEYTVPDTLTPEKKAEKEAKRVSIADVFDDMEEQGNYIKSNAHLRRSIVTSTLNVSAKKREHKAEDEDKQEDGDEEENFSKFRLFVNDFVESKTFGGAILGVIFFNTIIIGVQTDKQIEIDGGYYFQAIDQVLMGIYIFELVLKFYAYRSKFFSSGWNTFDFIIVLTSLTDYLQYIIGEVLSGVDTGVFRIFRIFRTFRAFRALRVLRTIRFLKGLQVIVFTIVRSIPAMGRIVCLMLLVMYVFAVIGMDLYSEVSAEFFGDLFVTFFTLFQLMTLDNWFDIYTAMRNKEPTCFAYLFFYIVIETFIFLNLFIAVIVTNFEGILKSMDEENAARRNSKRSFARSTADDQEDIDNEDYYTSPSTKEEELLHFLVLNDKEYSPDDEKTEGEFVYDSVTTQDLTLSDFRSELIKEYYTSLAALEGSLYDDMATQSNIDDLVSCLYIDTIDM
eukprot:Nk52_evm74s230 gene=Nk52_evmTU74s230